MLKRIMIFLTCIVLMPLTIQSQPYTITLELADLTNLDLGGLIMSGGLTNQPRIARIVITPENKDVYMDIVATWKKDLNSTFQQLFSFRTQSFKSRIIFNDELGSVIKGTGSWDKTLVEELAAKGKPTGVLGITARLYDRNNTIAGQDYKEFVFLNPSPTISIISPTEGTAYDVGSVIAIWTPVQGAASYKILANTIPDGVTSAEAALRSGNPIIDNKDVGNVTSVDLRSLLSREWIGGQRIVLSVTAISPGTGGGTSIASVPVTFVLNRQGEVTTPLITPELLKLVELINGQVSQDFINKIMRGEVTIEAIVDEADRSVDPSDLLRILNSLLMNRDSIISLKFTAK